MAGSNNVTGSFGPVARMVALPVASKVVMRPTPGPPGSVGLAMALNWANCPPTAPKSGGRNTPPRIRPSTCWNTVGVPLGGSPPGGTTLISPVPVAGMKNEPPYVPKPCGACEMVNGKVNPEENITGAANAAPAPRSSRNATACPNMVFLFIAASSSLADVRQQLNPVHRIAAAELPGYAV